MRSVEIIGSISTIILAALLLYTIVGRPPVYENWMEAVMNRLTPVDFIHSGKAISAIIWESLFPALIGLVIAILALTLALVGLLRR